MSNCNTECLLPMLILTQVPSVKTRPNASVFCNCEMNIVQLEIQLIRAVFHFELEPNVVVEQRT